jgi:hypothetical protein
MSGTSLEIEPQLESMLTIKNGVVKARKRNGMAKLMV